MIYDKRDLGALIPSYLDDYGLEPDEFRIYARIARRAGSGKCFESVDNISKACKMGQLRVKEVVRLLAIANMIVVFPKQGKPNEYALSSPDLWKPAEQLEELREEAYRHRNRTKKWRDNKKPTPDHGDTPDHGETHSQRSPTPDHGDAPTPDHGDAPPPITVTPCDRPSVYAAQSFQRSEGTPIKESLKGSHEGTPFKEGDRAVKIDPINRPLEPEWSNAPIRVEAEIISPVSVRGVAEDQGSVAPPEDLISSLMAIAPSTAQEHGARRMEARFNAQGNSHPWKRDERMLRLFLEYLTNTSGSRGDAQQKKQAIALGMLRKANRAWPGDEAYETINLRWLSFLQNGQQSATVQQLTGKASTLPASLQAMILERRRKQQNG